MFVDVITGEVKAVSYRDGTLNYDTNKVSDETGLACLDRSLAQQHQKDEADINYMIEKFGLAVVVEKGSIPWPEIVDVSEAGMEYGEALDLINQANKSFAALPAGVRARFNNDPAEFVDFCSDPGNLKELTDMGLAVKREVSNGSGSQSGAAGEATGGAQGASGVSAGGDGGAAAGGA